MRYQIIQCGQSRSFPVPHPLLAASDNGANALIYIGAQAAAEFVHCDPIGRPFVAIELGTECLGTHTGEQQGREGSNVVGFARFRLGRAEPTQLVEVVKQPNTDPAAVKALREVLEGAGLKVAVCGDFPGRIVDRLVRPYYNAALRRLDEGLATAEDMDTTLRLGLGYPEGPIALLERTGLANHHDVTQELHLQLADAAYAPARRAQVAKTRQGR